MRVAQSKFQKGIILLIFKIWKYNQMQAKTKSLQEVAMPLGLRVNKDKTKIMKAKTELEGQHK